MAHVKSPSFSAEDTVTKKSNSDNLNSDQPTKPTSVKVISIKSKSTNGSNSRQQSKFDNEPSGQSSHAKPPNDNTTQKSDLSSAINVSNISSRRRDRHSRNSSAHSNRSAGGNSSSKDSKKHGNVDVQISSSKSNDASNQKGSSATSTAENNKKSSTNESSIVPSPILSKKPKKKDKNTSTRKVLTNSVNNNNIKKDAKANEDSKSAENNAIDQKYVGKSNDNLTIDNTKEFQSGASFSGEIINNKMPADFKFDFESSPLLISLLPNISGPKDCQNDESGPNLSAFESSSLDFKTPTSTIFDLFSKDFNVNTSSIFNLQTSFSSAFGSSNNNPPGSPTPNNGNASLWTDPNPSNDTMINSNGSNGVKTTTASVEDLERQVANARREAEVLELRLRAVIKKNTHHLQDAWKS